MSAAFLAVCACILVGLTISDDSSADSTVVVDGVTYTIRTAGYAEVRDGTNPAVEDSTKFVQIPVTVQGVTVTRINSNAFYGLTNLESVSFGGSVTAIGDNAFRGCTGLCYVTLNSVTSVGSYSFYNCSSMISADVSNMSTIGSYAFYGCTSLANISLKSGAAVDQYAFHGCTNLSFVQGDFTKITFPTKMGQFTNCFSNLIVYNSGNGDSTDYKNLIVDIFGGKFNGGKATRVLKGYSVFVGSQFNNSSATAYSTITLDSVDTGALPSTVYIKVYTGAVYTLPGADGIFMDNEFASSYWSSTNPGDTSVTSVTVSGNTTLYRMCVPVKPVITDSSITQKYDGQNIVLTAQSDTTGVTWQWYKDGVAISGATGSTLVLKDVDDSGSYSVRTAYRTIPGEMSASSTVSISPRDVTLTSATDSKTYDGTALTNSKVTVSSDGFADGEGASYTVTGTQTNAGNSVNSFTYSLNSGTKASNYNISTFNGSLVINRAPMSINITSSKTYDSSVFPYTIKDGDITGLVSGDNLTAGAITTTGTIAMTYSVETTHWTVTTPVSTSNGISNYEVSFTVSLTITKRDISIRSDDATKVYDGNALTKNTYAVSSGSLAGSDTIISAIITGSITNVSESGTGNNTITGVTINNSRGANVSTSYDITLVAGDLSITPKSAVVTITADKLYDGTAFSYNILTSNVSGLVTGDAVTAGTLTTTSPNAKVYSAPTVDWNITAALTTSKGVSNYSVDYTVSMEITKRQVTLTSGNASKPYDGSPLTNSEVTVTGNGFVTGEGATYNVTGTQTSVGSSSNTFTYTLNSGTLAGNYTIETVFGTLTITSGNTITITVTNANKTYDGTPLTSDAFTYSGDLVAGDRIVITTNGSQTVVGSSVNAISTVKVMRGDVDVTSNYTFGTHISGTLTVSKAPLTVTINSSKTYDSEVMTYTILSTDVSGLVHGDSLTGGAVSTTRVFAATYTAQTSDWNVTTPISTAAGISNYEVSYNVSLTINKRDITIRSDDATKVYDGTPLAKGTYSVSAGSLAGTDVIFTVTISGSITTVSQSGTGNNTITAAVINSAGGVNVSSSYNITLAAGDLSITKKTLNITVSNSKMYDGTVLPFTITTAQASGLVAGDAVTAGAIATLSANVKAYTVKDTDWTMTTDLATSNGVGNYSVIYTVSLEITKRDVTLTSATDSKPYDGTPLTNSRVTVTGSGFVGTEGAEFTVTGTQTEPGTSDNTFNYSLKPGTLTGNYRISVVLGKLTVTTGNAITITVTNADKTYDGTPLTSDAFTYTGTLVEGDLIQITTGGTQTVVGSSPNAVLTVKIMRGQTDVTSNYTMGTHVAGTLTVTRAPLSVVISQTKTYDSSVFSYAAVAGDITGLVAGDYLTAGAVASTSAIAGTYSAPNTQWTTTTAFATANGISNYEVTYTVSLEITKRDITIKSDDATKVYDGTPLTKNTYAISAGSLAGIDSIFNVTISGSITNVSESGTGNNTITAAVINNAGGTNVSSSYNITLAAGDLTVTPKTLTITVNTDKMYDGSIITYAVATANASGLVAGDAVSAGAVATVSANVKDYTVRDTDWIITTPVSTSNGAGNYNITYSISLEITKRDVTLTSASNTKAYDGTPLTDSMVTATGSGFVGTEGADFTVTGTQTEPGTSDNTFTYTLKSGALAGNYQITVIYGKLTVTSGDTITVVVTNESKVYDGTPLTSDAFTYVGTLVSGDRIVITTTGTQTNVGTSDNAISTVKIMRGEVDVTGNYTMGTHVAGTLTVTKAALSITVSETKTYDATVFTYRLQGEDVRGLVPRDALTSGSIVSSSAAAGTYSTQTTDWHVSDAIGTLNGIGNYDVTYTVSLEITKRDVTIRSDDATKVYDGTPLIKRTCTVSVGSLAVGDTIGSAVINGIITNVSESGTGNNTITSVVINSSDSINVTSSYNITLVSGDLSVTKRSLTIEVVSYANGYYASKLYDGTKLSYDVTNLNAIGLVDGDDVVSGTITTVSADAGSYLVRNVQWNITTPIETTNGIDNYSVLYNVSMEILSRSVIITSDSDSKVYDATALEKHTVTITGDGFISGEGATCTFTGTQTNAGKSDNRFTYVLDDGTSADNYIITTHFGTLEVSKASMITVTLTNQSKVYDGTPLTSEAFTYSGTLVSGHTVVITSSGSQTTVGAGTNVLTSVRIMDGASDVTGNYNLGTHNNGTLTVTHAPLSIKVSSQKTYDGTSFIYAFKASDVTGLVSGDVIMSGTGIVTTTNEIAGTYDAEITGWTITTPLSTFFGVSNYAVSYDISLEITKRDITIRSDDATKVYDGSPLTKNTYSISSGSLALGDSVYSVSITGSITNVSQSGTGNNTVSSAVIINAGSTNVSDSYNITLVAGDLSVSAKSLVINISHSSLYDGSAYSHVIRTSEASGLVAGDAISGGVITTTSADANVYDIVKTEWTVTVPVTTVNGVDNYSLIYSVSLEIMKRNVTLTSGDATAKYDDTALTNVNVAVSGDGFVAGEGATYDVTGSQKYVGTSANVFSYTLSGSTKASNYVITMVNGTLTVTVRDAITVTLTNQSKVFDGTPLTSDAFTYTGALVTGHVMTVTADGTQTYTGSSFNAVTSVRIVDQTGKDVTSNYSMGQHVKGTLTVTKAALDVNINASKTYDGTVVVYEIKGTDLSGLVSGDSLLSGSVTTLSPNAKTYTVRNSDWDVLVPFSTIMGETNYAIHYNVSITIDTRAVTIESDSASKVYDGTPLTKDTYRITAGSIAETDRIESIIISGTATDVSDTSAGNNVLSGAVIKDGEGVTRTSNYAITYVAGTLTIQKRSLTITADGSSVTYGDAVPTLSVDNGAGWASGESYATGGMTASEVAAYLVTAYTSLSPAGTPVPITWSQSAAADLGSAFGNYSIDVDRKAVTVNIDCHKTYDGATYVYSILQTDVFGLVSGDAVKAGQVTTRSANVGTYTASADWFFSVPMETKNGIGNYQVTTYVSMVIEKKLLTLQNGSEPITRMYDGTDAGVTLTKGVHYILSGVVDGDNVDFVSSASRFNSAHVAGATKVTISSIALTNPNYTISTDSLTASITKRNVVLTSGSSDKVYDGTALTNSAVTTTGSLFAPGEGAGFSVTGSQVAVGSSDNTFTYSLFTGTEASDYEIQTIFGVLRVTTGTDIVITVLDADKIYDGTALVSNAFEFSGTLVKGNRIVITTDGSQTVVGFSANNVTSVIIYDAYNNDVTSNYTFGSHIPGKLTIVPKDIKVTFRETGTYDGNVFSHTVRTTEVSGLVDGDSITAGIMATASADAGTRTVVGTDIVFIEALATANGIGNYSVFYDVSFDISPRTVTVSNGSAAITKVYDATTTGIALTAGSHYVFANVVDGDSVDFVSAVCVFDSPYVATASMVNVTSTTLDNSNYAVGTVTLDASITPREITFRSDDRSKVFDGTPLVNQKYTLASGSLASGDSVDDISITGSIINVSESVAGNNTISGAVIKNAASENVTSCYTVTYVAGNLTVTEKPIQITVSDTAFYSGSAAVHTIAGSEVTGLVPGDHVTAGSFITNSADAGQYSSSQGTFGFSVPFETSMGAGNYSVTYTASMEITKRSVTMTSASASRAYDGTPLTDGTVNVTGDGFVAGQGAVYTVTGTQTYVGSSTNAFTFVLSDGTSAGNYEITTVFGTLTITPGTTITVTVTDAHRQYDGTPFTSDAFTYTGELIDGDVLVVVTNGSQTDAGSSVNGIVSVAIMRGTDDVTSNYIMGRHMSGTITVDKAPLTVRGTYTVIYDGSIAVYTIPASDVTGLVAGDSLTGGKASTVSQFVGTYSTYGTGWTFSEALATANGIGNYEVSSTITIEITKREITIRSDDHSKVYDGTPLTYGEYTLTAGTLASTDLHLGNPHHRIHHQCVRIRYRQQHHHRCGHQEQGVRRCDIQLHHHLRVGRPHRHPQADGPHGIG